MARYLSVLTLVTFLVAPAPGRAQQVPTPEQFFGFKPGADGELARYPKVLEYFQLLAKSTDRVKYEEHRQDDDGECRMRCCGSARRRIWRGSIGWSRSTGDSRIRAGCRMREAQKLAAEGKPFYLLYATIHSTEVSNGQAIIHIVHRLATENSPAFARSSTTPSC